MKILLVASTTGYQVRAFADAAGRVGATLVLATDRCHVIDDPWGDDAVAVRFDGPLESVSDLVARGPYDGIVAVGDRPAYAAALLAEKLSLPFSPPEAVRAAGNKLLSRIRFQAAGLLTPRHSIESAPGFPCVLKPLDQSAGKGVIRADDESEFAAARARIQALTGSSVVLAEDFIPGREFALEGLVTNGVLQTLALFDKPDPLDGPYFEESIYLTPSREPESIQRAIRETAQRAVAALGLTHGPVHAEMRVNPSGVWMLEIAARPIGGLCSRVLRFNAPVGPPRPLPGAVVASVGPAVVPASPLSSGLRPEGPPRVPGAVVASVGPPRPLPGAVVPASPLSSGLRPVGPPRVPGAVVASVGPAVVPASPLSSGLRPDVSLEELLLRHAAGDDVTRATLQTGAHGVMMIPVPGPGIFTHVDGVDAALNVACVEDIVITATTGQHLLPWPDGSSYPGFIFARAATAAQVESALRTAHDGLKFRVFAALPVVK